MQILVKQIQLTILFIFCFCGISISQPSTFYDFEGEDFELSVSGMVATQDSLYVLTKGAGTDTAGFFLRFDKNGAFEVIESFDGTISEPNSLIGNDSIVFGSTRFSENGGGVIFKYKIATGEYEIIKDLSPNEAQEVEIVHITDSLLWGLSTTSFEDEGSIFTIEHDGNNFNKIYNNTSEELGQSPTDIEIVDDQIYVSCFGGGGIPYPDGTGSTVLSGSIIRINMDGTGYTNIFQGRDMIGTSPGSLIREGDDIYVFFTGRGSVIGSSVYKFNIDDLNFEKLANLDHTGRSDLFFQDNLLLGITAGSLFEYDINTDELTSLINFFDDLSTFDGLSGPILFDRNLVVATQQGGQNNGGIIAKYNFLPEIIGSVDNLNLCSGFGEEEILLSEIVLDKDHDVSYSAIMNEAGVAQVSFSENSLVISEARIGSTAIEIEGVDQEGASVSFSFSLNIYQSYSEIVDASICQGETYVFGSQGLTEAGEYSQVFRTVSNCDSSVTVRLEVFPSFSEESVTICDNESYNFGSQILTAAGDYTQIFQSSNNCDSTVNLTLDVLPTFKETTVATICGGETFLFGSQKLTMAGEYTEIFQSGDGCDSTMTLTLEVIPFSNDQTASICEGEFYVLDSEELTTPGIYSKMFQSTDGCDSLVNLTLEVSPVINNSVIDAICNGESYSFGSQNLTLVGTYTEVFQSINGCDSTVELTLNSNPTFNEQIAATLCVGEILDFGTQSITEEGEYLEVFKSVSGCDSTVSLSLTFESCGVLSAVDNSSQEIKVFPNPVKETLEITFDQSINGMIQLINLSGQVFKKEKLYKQTKARLSLVDIPRGTYIISVKTADSGILLQRIIKE